MSGVVVEARGVVRDLGDVVPVRVLHGVDLAVREGELLALTGASGSGKSTLLYLLGALDRPTAGEVLVDGVPIGPLDDDARAALRAEKLGFVFQFHFLLPEFSSLENVAIPLLRNDVARTEALARSRAALAAVGLGDLEKRRPHELSGGQQQRVAVARALATRPRVLLADEPTGNLDTQNATLVMDLFERLVRDEGLTVVLVTHEPTLAARATRQVLMRDGRIVDAIEQQRA